MIVSPRYSVNHNTYKSYKHIYNMSDYSNTVFYKIYCKDTNIDDVYIGHTVNFVNRKYSHKNACNKTDDPNHHLKVYKIIREHGGWNNWKMDMIGFKNCKDRSEACIVEQEYVDSYKSSLNSILAHKPTIECIPTIIKDKINLNCEVCKMNFKSDKAFELHKKSKKHKKLVIAENNPEALALETSCYKYHCKLCDFKCNKMSNYKKHLLTLKHQKATTATHLLPEYKCECGKTFTHRGTLWNHRKKHCKLLKSNTNTEKK